MNGSVKVLWLAENGYHAGSSLLEHFHPEYYQLYCILDGEGTFLIDRVPVSFRPGLIFFMPPGMLHGIAEVCTSGEETVRLLEAKFTVQDESLREALAALPAVICGTQELQEQLYRIFLEGVRKNAFCEEISCALLLAWLYQLIRHSAQSGLTEAQSDGITARIRQYLAAHYQEDVSLNTLAKVTGYSKNYLCRIFREQTGMTINHCLSEVRIGAALELLAGSDLDLAEIARRCGYNSVFYFIKSFKRRMGIPPGNYRKSELIGVDRVEGRVDSVNTAMRASEGLLLRINQTQA